MGVFAALAVNVKTTNQIESVMARPETKRQKVTRGRTSDQKLCWRASVFWTAERQFRRVRGHRYQPLLRHALHARLSLAHSAAALAASPAASPALQVKMRGTLGSHR